jgi:Fur family transcriptional regulator, iron response regulator
MKTKKLCPTPQEIEGLLKKSGLNPTAQRIAIARYVLCEADHPTADQVKTWADGALPKVSLATVYNTLNALVKAGLLRELKLEHSGKVIYDDRVEEHHHFLDEATGELLDLEADEVEVKPRLKKGFKVKQVSVLIRGTRT